MEAVPSVLRHRFALLWRDLRRAGKDARSRQRLWRAALLPAFALYMLGYLAAVYRSGAPGVAGLVIAAVMTAVVVLYRRRRPAERGGPLTLSLSEPVSLPEPPPLHDTPELRRSLAELALLHAILAHRAASEAFLKHSGSEGAPPGQEVVTRQRHLKLLRDYGMLDRLHATERDLILLPDGAWDEDAIERGSLLLDPLRALRWLLGVEPVLPEIGDAPLLDFPLASSLVHDPAAAFENAGLEDMENIRSARFAAEQMFYRCYAEGQRRGFYTAADPENVEKAIFYAERLAGLEDKDFLLGPQSVSRAGDEPVRLAATLALRRARLLRSVQERLYGTQPAPVELQVL